MKKWLALISLACLSAPVKAMDSFVVKDIKLEGLQRISIGTVFNYLPIKPGDTVNNQNTVAAIKALYKTGFFKDVHLEREGDVLVVFVAERPAINDIKIEGYEEIKKEQLDQAMKNIGMVKGQVFNRSILDKIEQELQRQYYSLGNYAVKLESEVIPLERNRVNVVIKIAEGEAAQIYKVSIIGNKDFSNEDLISRISLADTGFFGGRNSYQKQQLAADLETIKSFYLDRGYIKFNINSTQVALSPDKESVYISINMEEGRQYSVSDIKLMGDLKVDKDELLNHPSV